MAGRKNNSDLEAQRGGFSSVCSVILLSLAMLSCTLQAICVASALSGGRESRLYLMGAFELSPVSLALAAAALAVMLFNKPETPTRRMLKIIASAVVIAQILLCLLG